MKKLFSLMLSLLLITLHAAQAESADFLQLTGLNALTQAVRDGAEVTSLQYETGTKIARGFTLEAGAELDALLDALLRIEIAGKTEEFVTDMYPNVALTLSDGQQFRLAFDGRWLTVDGQNYALKNDADFWQQVRGLLEKYSPMDALEPRYMPNCVDLYFPANPTTGYVWTWTAEEPYIVSVTDQYFPDEQTQANIAGAGGRHWFHFDGLQPGVTAVTLTYGRPWEETPLSFFTFRVTVNEQLDVLIWGVEANPL